MSEPLDLLEVEASVLREELEAVSSEVGLLRRIARDQAS